MKTEFIELAVKIHSKINSPFWFLCYDLSKEKAVFIEKYFKPTDKERIKFDMNMGSAWLSEEDAPFHQDNQFRIMVLLFADLMWRDEYGS